MNNREHRDERLNTDRIICPECEEQVERLYHVYDITGNQMVVCELCKEDIEDA
jgi:hypothetical protein